MAFQDYKLPKGMNCYPVTLIYYPKQDPDTLTERSLSIALGDDELLGQKITSEEFLSLTFPEGVPAEPSGSHRNYSKCGGKLWT